MKHSQLMCRSLAILFKSACYIWPLLSIYFIFFNLPLAFKLGYFRDIIAYSAIESPHAFIFFDKLILITIETLSLFPSLFIFYALQQLFKEYANSQYFETKNNMIIKRIGTWMLLGQLLHPAYQCLMTVYLTRYNQPGHHLLSLSLGSQNISAILTALIVFVCAHIMHQASLLARDNALTI